MIPLNETPIYAEMKFEEFDRALETVKRTFTQVADAINELGRGARIAFAAFDELHQSTPRKQLISNGGKPR